jgi:hypothetical protein
VDDVNWIDGCEYEFETSVMLQENGDTAVVTIPEIRKGTTFTFSEIEALYKALKSTEHAIGMDD